MKKSCQKLVDNIFNNLSSLNIPQEVIKDAKKEAKSIDKWFEAIDEDNDYLKGRVGELENESYGTLTIKIKGLNILQKQKLEEFIKSEIFPYYADETQYTIPY